MSQEQAAKQIERERSLEKAQGNIVTQCEDSLGMSTQKLKKMLAHHAKLDFREGLPIPG